ncbi:hypothetical protein [Streptomyces sp. NPDC020965]|uniref:hypothetical protein n=1 Tax=Streptomyces sp. NPDC020965 TaxID=3365105 RepID=UPI0037B91642
MTRPASRRRRTNRCRQPARRTGWTRTRDPWSIGELRAALTPWPDLLAQFTTELEAAPFHQDGAEPLRAVRDVISAYRVEWMARVHPDIVRAVADDEAGIDNGVPLDVVMAEYDPDTYQRRDEEVRELPGSAARRGRARRGRG